MANVKNEKLRSNIYWDIHPYRKRIEVYQNREDRLQLFRTLEEKGTANSELSKDFGFDVA
jgi:hypothetical protein